MFTWECPRCRREVDISETECPHCEAEAAQAAVEPTAAPAASEALSPPSPLPAVEPRRARAAVEHKHAGLKPAHIVIFLVLIAAFALGAVYLARPDLLTWGGEPEPTAMLAAGRGRAGELEVTGVRARYDESMQPKVRAVVVNHAEQAQEAVTLDVVLRASAAAPDTPPLASFEVALEEPLEPGASREVETDLVAAGTVQALPPWHEMRVDVERR